MSVLLVLGCTCGCNRQQTAAKTTAPMPQEAAAGQPRIAFPETSHDFGHVEADSRLEYSFAFTNEGSTPLEIKKVVASCGCMVGRRQKDTLQAGEVSEITLRYSVGKYAGRKSQTVSVVSNDPVNPRIALTLSAEVPPSAAAAAVNTSAPTTGSPPRQKERSAYIHAPIKSITRELLSKRK